MDVVVKRGGERVQARRIAFSTLKYVLLALILLFFLFPFFVMLTRSFMTSDEAVFDLPERIFPARLSFEGYTSLFADKNFLFGNYLANTLVIILFNMFGQAISASLCAFGFTKLRFKGREMAFAIVLSTIMLPGIAMQVPLYIIYDKLRWTSTVYPLIVPAWFGGGVVNIFLLRQYMRSIKNDMLEAAKIDGANLFTIYLRIVLPLCKPVLMLIMVNAFFASWNDYSGPLMYLQTRESYTLSLGLYYKFRDGLAGGVYANEMMAAGVVMTLPCAVLFFLFQKQLIDGVQMGSVKG